MATKKTKSKKIDSKKEVAAFSQTGRKLKSLGRPDFLGEEVNPQLVSQAVRVYLANKRRACAVTKRRGDVRGSRKKIWRQKGTGRARHGDRYAPIFVGGGTTFGPTGEENWHLSMPKKMRRKAFFSVLGQKIVNGNLIVAKNLEKLPPKTKKAVLLISKIAKKDFKKPLLVVEDNGKKFIRAFSNIENMTIREFDKLNTYLILERDFVIFQSEAWDKFRKFWKERLK